MQILGDQGYTCMQQKRIYSLIQKQRVARIQMYSINALKKQWIMCEDLTGFKIDLVTILSFYKLCFTKISTMSYFQLSLIFLEGI